MTSRRTQALRYGYHLLRAGLFRYGGGDAEKIHEAMFTVLSKAPVRRKAVECDPVTVAGIRFPNRVGLAAGLDKDGLAAAAWASFGFGFAELGTVTAKPQPGNPKPRVFRAIESQGIVNRMGFNNRGAAVLAAELARRGVLRGNNALAIPLGISIGKTKVTPLAEATADYLQSLRCLAPYADYIAINVSSPNTPGLRSLQQASELAELLHSLTAEAAQLDPNPVPIFVKLAPDLTGQDLTETLAVIKDSAVSGVIATNTTLSRDGLVGADVRLADEAGGLSGAPLTAKALAFVESLAGLGLPLMGVGGIMTPRDAQRMFDAGAELIQLYTGFIFEGPALIQGIHDLRKQR